MEASADNKDATAEMQSNEDSSKNDATLNSATDEEETKTEEKKQDTSEETKTAAATSDSENSISAQVSHASPLSLILLHSKECV